MYLLQGFVCCPEYNCFEFENELSAMCSVCQTPKTRPMSRETKILSVRLK